MCNADRNREALKYARFGILSFALTAAVLVSKLTPARSHLAVASKLGGYLLAGLCYTQCTIKVRETQASNEFSYVVQNGLLGEKELGRMRRAFDLKVEQSSQEKVALKKYRMDP